MANLQIKLFNKTLKNPIMPAAGPNSLDGKTLLQAYNGGAGALLMKTISIKPAKVPYPNICCASNNSLLNTELWSEIPYQQYLEKEYKIAKSSGLYLIASIGYTPNELEFLAKKIANCGYVDAIEFSVHYIGREIEEVINSAKAIKKVCNLPILAKLSPGFADIPKLVKALDNYVDGFVCINSVGPALNFNPENLSSYLGSKNGVGWLSGRAIFNLALHTVYTVYKNTKKPVFGVGGVYNGVDAVKMMMTGATCVQVCSAAIEKGHNVYGKIANELSSWLDAHNYKSAQSIIGLYAQKNIEESFTAKKANVNNKNCINCQKCVKGCMHKALSFENKKIETNQNCIGCGYCVSICPVNAINLE